MSATRTEALRQQLSGNVWQLLSAIQFAEDLRSVLGEVESEVEAEEQAVLHETLTSDVQPVEEAIETILAEPIAPAELARFSNQSESEVQRWILEGRIQATEGPGGVRVTRREVVEQTLQRLRRSGQTLPGFGGSVEVSPSLRLSETNEPLFSLYALPTGPWQEAPERFGAQLQSAMGLD